MSNHPHKFLFLGAMFLLLMLFGSNSFYSKAIKTENFEKSAMAKLDPPTFVLTPPDNGESAQEKTQSQISTDPILNSGNEFLGQVFYKYGADLPPEIGVQAALIGDLLSGEVLWSKNQERRWPLASVTKLMTASVISANMPLNGSTTITNEDFLVESEHSIPVGSRLLVGDLMKAVLLVSSNESAEAAARIYGRADFLTKMNENAKNWGLESTFFDDPTGLSASNQSTAADLLKFAGQIYHYYPEVFKITIKSSASILDLNSGKNLLIKNINSFAGRPGFLGGKTGYTDEASGNLLSIFSYKRRPTVIVVLGTEDRFGDTEKLLKWFETNFR